MDPTQAGVQLGDLIFQGNDPRNYSKALAQQAAGIAALWNARDARAKSMLRNEQLAKRAGLADDFQKLGYDPNAAGAVSDILRSNGTVNLGDLGYFKNPNATEGFAGARHAVETGNLGDYNFDTALATGKPIRAYNPFKSPDQPFNAAPTTVKPGQIKALPASVLKAYFSNGDALNPGIDKDAYDSFLQFAAQGGYRDLQQALPAWSAYQARLQQTKNQATSDATSNALTNLGIPHASASAHGLGDFTNLSIPPAGLGDMQHAPPAALQALRQNPTPLLKQQFVEKYGYLPAGLP
ncbi:MAG TPA: hypothetical protein VFW88_07045 [Burkholderiales bacterium]|nr:hypothetical protein [Burkholderiales bacterium]